MTFDGQEVLSFDVRRRVAGTALHSLHECRTPSEFCVRFESTAGCSVVQVADHLIAPDAERAIFLVGSLCVGTATGGSDVDLLVLVDGREVLLERHRGSIREGSNDLLVSHSWCFAGGIDIDVMVAITPTVKRIYDCLEGNHPWASESEIMILSRLGTGWLLCQSDGYLARHEIVIDNSTLDLRCSLKRFVFARACLEKAVKALAVNDLPLTLHYGRLSVERAYLAYFSSEGLSYLGENWLAQVNCTHSAWQRLGRHSLLKEYVHLLFPCCRSTHAEAVEYLSGVSAFLEKMRHLIEEKNAYRDRYAILDDVFRSWTDQYIVSHVDERRCYSTI